MKKDVAFVQNENPLHKAVRLYNVPANLTMFCLDQRRREVLSKYIIEMAG